MYAGAGHLATGATWALYPMNFVLKMMDCAYILMIFVPKTMISTGERFGGHVLRSSKPVAEEYPLQLNHPCLTRCVKLMKFAFKNEELCIKNEEICI